MADVNKNYTFKLTLIRVPEFGKLEIIYDSDYRDGHNKAQKLLKMFSGNTEKFTLELFPSGL